MKKFVFFSMVVFVANLSGCKKNTSVNTSGIYKGVVLFRFCNNIVIQTLDPDYLGQDNWTSSGPVYNHVFAVQNFCQFGDYAQGDTINFKVIPSQVQNCMRLDCVDPIPASIYAIQAVP